MCPGVEFQVGLRVRIIFHMPMVDSGRSSGEDCLLYAPGGGGGDVSGLSSGEIYLLHAPG